MNERVLEIIKKKDLTPSRFADIIGVPRSTISHIISGRNNPSLELISKISDKFPDVYIDWLVKGKGPMMRTQTSLFEDGANISDKDTGGSDTHSNTQKEDENLISSKNQQIENETTNGIKNIPSAEENNKKTANSGYAKKSDISKVDDEQNISKIIIIYNDDRFKTIYPVK